MNPYILLDVTSEMVEQYDNQRNAHLMGIDICMQYLATHLDHWQL